MTKDAFFEGQLVRVEARTWPGINKPGGVGRIIRLIANELDVQYVLGGGEKGVPLQYVSIVEEFSSQNSLRDRSILLGRCKQCGSLRADCGSCDLRQYHNTGHDRNAGTNPRPSTHDRIALDVKSGNSFDNSSDEESDSSSDGDFLAAFQKNPRLRRNLNLLNRLERDTRPKRPNENALNIAIESRQIDEGSVEVTQTLSPSNLNSSMMFDDGSSELSSDVSPVSRRRRLQHSSKSATAGPSPRDGALLVDNDLEGFIQPEGAATSAPRGSDDKTMHLAFEELPNFFEATLNRVSNALPEARVAFKDISRRVDMRKAVCGQIADLEEEGWQLYDSTKEKLVLGGLDQCRFLYTVRRLNSRKEFRKHEATLSRRQKKRFKVAAQNLRDILFDQTDKEVEDFLRELRHYLDDLKSSRDDELFGEVDSERSQSTQETRHYYSKEEEVELDSASDILPEFDPHRHARRIPRDTGSIRSKPERLRRDHRKRPRAGSETEVVPNVLGGVISSRCASSRQVNPKRRSIATNMTKLIPPESSGFTNPTNGEFQFPGKSSRFPRKSSHKPRTATFTASYDLPRSFQGIRRRGERESAVADRMQAFLEANRENVDAGMEPRSEMKIADQSNADSLAHHTLSLRNWDEEVFRTFSNLEMPDSVIQQERDSTCISHCIGTLRLHCQPLPSEDEFLDRIYHDSQSYDALMSRGDVVSLFSIIHSYLKKNPESLQELVSTAQPKLSRHLRILETLMTLLSMDLQRHLQKGDGIIFSVFSGTQPCLFVQLLILQLLDVLLALFNPEAFAMKSSFRQVNVLRTFSPLRNAMARLVSLVEVSCQYVLHRVESQRWCSTRDGSVTFVSCLDPDMCRSFLETAEIPSPVCGKVLWFCSLSGVTGHSWRFLHLQ